MGFLSRMFGGRPRNIIGEQLTHLTPENPLEHLLCAARDGKGSIEAFVDAMLQSQLFLPSEIEPEETTEGAGFQPIVANVGDDTMVIACTSDTRTSTLVNLELRSGVLVDGEWVIRMLPDGTGLWINPGWDASLMMRSSGMRGFKADRGLT